MLFNPIAINIKKEVVFIKSGIRTSLSRNKKDRSEILHRLIFDKKVVQEEWWYNMLFHFFKSTNRGTDKQK
jgi:hypothetical protein